MSETSEASRSYEGEGKLLTNYGWVQNTSNLSTVRDTVELVSEEGMNHNALMRAIKLQREADGKKLNKWTWDARCRCKAVCATGMVELDRRLEGYKLTEFGKELIVAPKANITINGKRALSQEEVTVFRKGLLTNPPVVRVLTLLNDSRKSGKGSMTKYDVGAELGFVGDIGFTHYDAEFVVANNKSFNDMEGDSDKWARTILSWLKQVNWVVDGPRKECCGRKLPSFTTTPDIDKVLQYSARSSIKYVPIEMLCSDHHPFTHLIQRRRAAILEQLEHVPYTEKSKLVDNINAQEIEIDEQQVDFDIINLQQAGIAIFKEQSYYKLCDKIKLDKPIVVEASEANRVNKIEKKIEEKVTKYNGTIPSRIVGDLIRYGYDGRNSSTLFEMTVNDMFKLLGYESEHLGEGKGRVADVISKYRSHLYAKSYGLIIDAKAYEKYNFPASDIRKMKEYISLHGEQLLADRIPRHAFAFVSMDFTNDETALSEIANDTAVNGTSITVDTLLELGAMVATQQVNIADIYDWYVTNKRFSIAV